MQHEFLYVQAHITVLAYRIDINSMTININNMYSTINISSQSSNTIKKTYHALL